ncbi:hypothetical protein IWX75_003588, partial [Arthrobacter sp. CAN_A6]
HRRTTITGQRPHHRWGLCPFKHHTHHPTTPNPPSNQHRPHPGRKTDAGCRPQDGRLRSGRVSTAPKTAATSTASKTGHETGSNGPPWMRAAQVTKTPRLAPTDAAAGRSRGLCTSAMEWKRSPRSELIAPIRRPIPPPKRQPAITLPAPQSEPSMVPPPVISPKAPARTMPFTNTSDHSRSFGRTLDFPALLGRKITALEETCVELSDALHSHN